MLKGLDKKYFKALMSSNHWVPGFTLAELLIALAILGVIATFTIPKVLQSSQDQHYMAEAKEVAGVISTGFQQLQNKGGLSANSTANDILNSGNLNYVKVQTTGTIDRQPGVSLGTPTGSTNCLSNQPCYILHNGSALAVNSDATFTGSGSTNAIYFFFDPDAVPTGATTGNGKSVLFILFYNGRLSTEGQYTGPRCDYWSGCYVGNNGSDPAWFSW